MVLALNLAALVIVALLLGLTWATPMLGLSLAALKPLYYVGLVIAACLVYGARFVRKTPHA
jgi:hypothetical protein